MGWSGGAFSRFFGSTGWSDDKSAGTNIVATRHDTHDQDISDGINACLTRDNQAKPNADFAPNADNTLNIGSVSFRWHRVYGVDLRLDDNSIFIDQDGAGTLRLGGTGGDWSRLNSEYPVRCTFPSGGGVASLQITSTLPGFEANDTDAGADAKIWDELYQSGVLSSRLVKDDRSSALIYRSVTRTGITSAIVNYGTGVTLQNAGRDVGYRGGNQNSQAAGYTFVLDDRGRAVAASSAGNFTVPSGVFSTGDVITFVTTAGSCTLVQGAGMTLRLVGASGTTGNRTVADWGIATIYFQTASVALVGGVS